MTECTRYFEISSTNRAIILQSLKYRKQYQFISTVLHFRKDWVSISAKFEITRCLTNAVLIPLAPEDSISLAYIKPLFQCMCALTVNQNLKSLFYNIKQISTNFTAYFWFIFSHKTATHVHVKIFWTFYIKLKGKRMSKGFFY